MQRCLVTLAVSQKNLEREIVVFSIPNAEDVEETLINFLPEPPFFWVQVLCLSDDLEQNIFYCFTKILDSNLASFTPKFELWIVHEVILIEQLGVLIFEQPL